MLKQLKLKNFRRHRDLTLDLTPGLNVIRGENEAGKSTITEALAYALFGSTVLRNSLADTVTWGEPEKSLKAEAVLQVNGQEYTFSRSKGGAEVVVDGKVYVSGQKEVASFAANLIGADAGTAARLMMAGQGNLRGALEQGPKAAAEMVEDLADFNLFETLLERMQEKLALGSDAPYRQRLEEVEQKLSDFCVQEPDIAALQATIDEDEAFVVKTQAWIDDVGQAEYEAAKSALDAAQNQKRTYDMLVANLDRAKRQRSLHEVQLKEQQALVHDVDTSVIESLSARVKLADAWAATREVFVAMQKLVDEYPDVAWEGTASSLDAEIDSVSAQVADLKMRHQQVSAECKEISASIVKDMVCKACGQPIKDHAEVRRKNDELAERVAVLKQQMDSISAESNEKSAELSALQAVKKSAQPYDKFLLENAQHVQADLSHVPCKLSWKGEEPAGELEDVKALQAQIQAIQAEEQAVLTAKARCEALAASLREDDEAVAAAEANLAEVSDPGDIEALRESTNAAGNAVMVARFKIEDARRRQAETRAEIKLATQRYEQALSQREQLQAQAQQIRDDIEALSFNNALLKKVRAARPLVADKLWNMVLAAVSTMFTQMRGEKSIVSKGKDGFTVNGESATSLSGSALDLLGLAIRVALTKTFVPAAPWLILDEPAAAMSDNRTEKMLGFIQSTGFAQIILVTHEDTSESVADNLIAL